jgi:hypothetical protein
MCVDEQGTSPEPPHRDELINYEDYVRWLDAAVKVETLPCARATTFPQVRYAESHASERSYHLDLARATLIQTFSDVVRRYHHDAADRISVPRLERDLQYAPDEADDARDVLHGHGAALKRFAPRTYRTLMAHASMTNFVAGRRRAGLLCALRAWPLMPFSPRLYAITLFGLFGPRALAQLRQVWWRASRAAAR